MLSIYQDKKSMQNRNLCMWESTKIENHHINNIGKNVWHAKCSVLMLLESTFHYFYYST